MKPETKRYLLFGAGIVAIFLCVYYWEVAAEIFSAIFTAAVPLIIGGVIAYLLNILMSCYERNYFPHTSKKLLIKSRRPVCLVAAILSMVAIIALIIGLVLPELVSCVKLLVAELPGYIEVVLIWLEDHGILSDENFKFLSEIDWKSRIGEIFNMLTSGMGSVVDTVFKTVTSVFSGIVTALLAIIFAVYLLISKDKLLSQTGRVLRHYLKSGIYDKLHYIFVTFEDCMHKYVVGQCTEAVILGLLCTVGMMIFRFPYATMIGALTAFTALIPIAGAYIGAGVGAFMILTESPMQALLFLIFIVVLQQLEGNIIYPRVVGSSIGLPGIWVLAAVTIGGGIAGVSGMLLGVPITAAIYRIVRDDMNKKEPKNKIKT